MFEALFEPIKIGRLTIPNRFVMPAMDTCLTDGNHVFTKQAADYYRERALGGYGLQFTEFLAVREDGIANPVQGGIYDDRFIPGLKQIVDEVHEAGGRIFAQLQHSGRVAQLENPELSVIGPSRIPYGTNGREVREIRTEEIPDLIKAFTDAAQRAQKAGFDGVELHGAHGYLLDQFLSKACNNRTDIYGGSPSNNARLICEILKAVKQTCGNDFPVSVRINGADPQENGNTIEDAMVHALLIEEAGADVINVSYGSPIESYYTDAGFNMDNVRKIKDLVHIPVIGVGRINDPVLALSAVKGKYMDLVATGRQSIADPHFPEKIKEGRIDEIITCTGCMQRCLYRKFFEEGYGISCMNNPFSGKEGTWKITPAETPKKIAVAGAGPAGLQAAWILAKRGHTVEVFEKENMPGGQFRLASVPPMKSGLAKNMSAFETIGKKYGAVYHYGTEVNRKLLEENEFDIVVDTTGSVPVVPRIEGIHGDHVCLAQEVLTYTKQFSGQKLLVLGAGLVGAETAEVLSKNNQVTLVDMLDKAAPLAPSKVRASLIRHLEENHVSFILGSKVAKINNDGIAYTKDEQQFELSGYDAVILAFGARSNTKLKDELTGADIIYVAAGDSSKAGDAKKAIFEATQTAMQI
ncbi:MAG TPA: NADH:flavin oxidoreductase [Erysipelotrichaceae bacterium]|nr:NADH:flavin oxidoreductase [Erysipelotrichaceae bacterium]